MRSDATCRFVLLAVGLTALLGAGCSRRTASGTVGGSAPCILLVTQELLRFDRVGAPEAPCSGTPAFDALAAAGAGFDDLQAVAPLSLPAHASILTGLQPPEHGLRVPGAASLGKDVMTLAAVLRTAGYDTAAVLASPELHAGTGLNCGFDQYDAPDPGEPRGADIPSAGMSANLRFQAFETPPHAGTRGAEEVVDAALAWLNKRTARTGGLRSSRHGLRLKQPFFLWVQLADTRRTDAADRSADDNGYDAGIASMDRQLGRLVEFLDQAGLRDRTLVLALGVHGTPLGPEAPAEEGLTLTDETLHIPCALRWPGQIPAGTRIAGTCNQTVLAPTVLELAGYPNALPAPLPERSLAAALGGDRPPPASLPAYAESLWPEHAYALPPRIGWSNAEYRFLSGSGFQPRRSLPQELSPPAYAEGEATLARLQAEFSPLPGTQRLAPRTDAAFALEGSMDRTAFVMLWQGVARRMRRPDPSDETLLEDCRRLVEGRPEHAPFHTWLGIAHSLRQQSAEALAAHRRAQELAPTQPHLLSNLGIAYLQAGDIVKAIDHLENAYLARPDDPGFRDNLATVLLSTGVALARGHAFNDAMACMTRVLFLQPENPAAHVHLGELYREMNRTDMAAASFRRALELRPRYAPAQAALQKLSTRETQ